MSGENLREDMAKGLISPWHPETSPHRLKALGKLAEETGELGSAVARCIIQGIDEVEPVTKKPNRQWLQEEVADVKAAIKLVEDTFRLDGDTIFVRAARKLDGFRRWMEML